MPEYLQKQNKVIILQETRHYTSRNLCSVILMDATLGHNRVPTTCQARHLKTRIQQSSYSSILNFTKILKQTIWCLICFTVQFHTSTKGLHFARDVSIVRGRRGEVVLSNSNPLFWLTAYFLNSNLRTHAYILVNYREIDRYVCIDVASDDKLYIYERMYRHKALQKSGFRFVRIHSHYRLYRYLRG